jgi:hypothetical protein
MAMRFVFATSGTLVRDLASYLQRIVLKLSEHGSNSRDKANLDIFWLKDDSLEDSANLPNPDVIAAEIVEDLQAALAQFAEIAADLKH